MIMNTTAYNCHDNVLPPPLLSHASPYPASSPPDFLPSHSLNCFAMIMQKHIIGATSFCFLIIIATTIKGIKIVNLTQVL